jgi:hypothetical protein
MGDGYLSPDNVDDLARMLMALLSEVWIMRDRMAIQEKLLGEKLGVSAAEIDDYVPDADFSAKLEALRDRLVSAVISAPLSADDRSVDSILRRGGFTDAAERLKSGGAGETGK